MAAGSLNMIIRVLVQTGRSASGINTIRKAFAELAAAAAGLQLVDAFVEANREIDKLLRGLNAVTRSQADVYFERLAQSAIKLGIPIKEVSLSFLELNAATRDTAFEGVKTQALFESLGNALSVTGADAVRFNRGFRAITQILSKDQLFAEELRQQLGEALPTAVQDFARALDITPLKLFKFMEQGAISGDELRRALVLVTKEWQKAYPLIDKKDFTIDQKLAVVKNQFLLLSKEIGDTGVWDQFGDSILAVENILLAARGSINKLAVEIKATFRTVAEEVRRLENELDSTGVNIRNIFDNVEFSPTGLIRNFRFVFEALPDEARQALKPVEDAIASIDFSKIAVSAVATFRAVGEGIGVFVGTAVDTINTLFRVLGESDQIPVLAFKNWSASVGLILRETYDEVVLFLTKTDNAFRSAQIKAKLFYNQLFGGEEGAAGLDASSQALFKRLADLEASYKEAQDASKARSASAQADIDKENQKLEKLISGIGSSFAALKERNVSAFNDIGKNLVASLDRLAANKELERQNLLINEASKREQQRSLFHKEYIDNLNAETRAKTNTLKITREQASAERDLIRLTQSYQDTLVDISNEQYKRWAQQGQITQEAAKFFERSAKNESLRKAWNLAQEAVERYNKEAELGKGADLATLEALKDQAQTQLGYAASKAKEVGDAYKVKQIYEAQVGLIESQKKAVEDIRGVLDRAEIKAGIKKVPVEEVKNVVSDVQRQFNEITPASVPTTVDPARQNVFRDYEEPVTKLPDAVQYVRRVYRDGTSGGESIQARRWGGFISGYGGGDRIRALLEPGEFVLRKEVVRSLGLGWLETLNRSGRRAIGSIPRFEAGSLSVPRFASGGPVEMQPIVINVPGRRAIRVSGNRDQAEALANLLTSVGRAL